jgi:uncharacterized membrane protein
MLQPIRLVTVHPLLVHLTIGGVVAVVFVYLVAAWRRSPAWSLAGDVAVTATSLITLLTFAFGLISNAVLPWPGGVDFWRWLHLGFAASVTAMLVGLAAVRLLRRNRHPVSGKMTAAVSVLIAILGAWTGWIGGEVLVYRAGMAVTAAGDGALAPPVVAAHGTPNDIQECMHRLRAHWGSTTARLASMVVQHPTAADFAVVAGDSAALEQLAGWLAESAGAPQNPGDESSNPIQRLRKGAEQLKQAAQGKQLAEASRWAGEVESACADCHARFRWMSSP